MTSLMGQPLQQGPGSAVDAYGPNPLAECMRVLYPERFAAVAAVVPPPKMFAGGTADVPAFTASGLDPELLLRLPYGMRHAVATETNLTFVYRLFEEHAGNPTTTMPHPGLEEAKYRIERWLNDTDADTRPAAVRQAEADADHESVMEGMFGLRRADDGSGWMSRTAPLTGR